MWVGLMSHSYEIEYGNRTKAGRWLGRRKCTNVKWGRLRRYETQVCFLSHAVNEWVYERSAVTW